MPMRAYWSAIVSLALALSANHVGRAADADPFDPITTDLTSPLGKRLRTELDTIDREIGRLRQLGGKHAARAERLVLQIRPIRATLDAGDAGALLPGADTPELHVIGLYEGDHPDHDPKFGSATVSVEATGRPIVLVLSGHSPIRWHLRVAAGAKLRKVIASGYDDQVVEPHPVDAEVETRTHSGGGAGRFDYVILYNHGAPEIASAHRKLKGWTGLDVTTSQGWYSAPTKPIVVGPSNTDWRIQRALFELEPIYGEVGAFARAAVRQTVQSLRFTAIRWTLSPERVPVPIGELGDFTGAGPIDESFHPMPGSMTRVVVDPRGPTVYGLTSEGLVRYDRTLNAVTRITTPADLPKMSWPCGIAFDTKRNRIVIASFGGVGHLYAYRPDVGSWSLLGDMNNLDLASLTYAADEDCFYGISTSLNGGGGGLYRIDGAGKSRAVIELKGRIPHVAGPQFRSAPAQLVATGGKLVLLSSTPDGTGGMTTTVIDPKSREVLMSEAVRTCVAPRTLPPAERERLWQLCANVDPVAAAKAVGQLCAGGDATVAFVRSELPAPTKPDPADVARLIRQLDHEEWKMREAAQGQLVAVADQVEPDLKAAFQSNPSAEVRGRLAVVFKDLERQRAAAAEEFEQPVRDPAVRLRLRAVRVLENIGTPNAVELLRDLANESPGTLIATSAASALRRL